MNLRRWKVYSSMLLIFSFISLARATSFPFEYDWVGTSSSDINAKIFLDAPSSLNGSLADVDLANSFINIPSHLSFNFAVSSALQSTPPFTWNSSQILTMNISGSILVAGPGVIVWNVTANSINVELISEGGGTLFSDSDVGSWVAASTNGTVPDNGNTALLFASVVTLFAVGRLFFRRSAVISS